MITTAKWLITILFAGLAWLVGNYTVEYFRPYKKIEIRLRGRD